MSLIDEFQCIKWKRMGAEHVARQTAGMSIQEELLFWQKMEEKMKAQQEQMKSQSSPAPTEKGKP